MATEAGLSVDVVREFEMAAGTRPLLTAIRRNGAGRVPDLERAGGARAVMSRLVDALDTTGVARAMSRQDRPVASGARTS